MIIIELLWVRGLAWSMIRALGACDPNSNLGGPTILITDLNVFLSNNVSECVLMDRKIGLYGIIFSLFLVTSVLGAFDFGINPQKQVAFQGETVTYTIQINNTGSDQKTYGISVLGRDDWVTIEDNNVVVPSGGTVETRVLITPPRNVEANTYGFDIVVTPSDEPFAAQSKNILLTVKEKEGVIISKLGTNKDSYDPGEIITINSELKSLNANQSSGTLEYTITDLDGNEITRTSLDVSIPSDDTISYEKKVEVGDWDNGDYIIEASLKDNNRIIFVKTTDFEINPIVSLSQQKDTDFLIYKINVDIEVTNSGNDDAENVEVNENINSIWTRFVDESDATVKGNTYTWTIDNIPSDGTKTVSYSIVLWPLYLLAIAFAGFVYWVYWFFFTPKTKKYVLQKSNLSRGNTATVMIRIRNKGRRRMKNVHVEDLVVPAFNVTKTGSPLGDIKNATQGTHVKWSLGSIQPGEERILKYDIKAVMGVLGKIKMPKARVKATIGETRKEWFSNAPSAEGESKDGK